jgi:hypothetical protein
MEMSKETLSFIGFAIKAALFMASCWGMGIIIYIY